jgi:hypothetical protein
MRTRTNQKPPKVFRSAGYGAIALPLRTEGMSSLKFLLATGQKGQNPHQRKPLADAGHVRKNEVRKVSLAR